ncbi:hypothetical protein DL89DRAFT_265454 [Linderina pennispora]|uniref:Clp ATPase C-terminal domain-containing protein n=1 Tax=Linderina pennispora TaxID=61395 RepID=A0A1Y1WJT9_9FUNG|nr:uncharacterized protein DL89DRAFT_265454 [Linderina pennispora]ORX73374.1 hypothetical protein DL89DRAFT_265454 [Linderina pennispora]
MASRLLCQNHIATSLLRHQASRASSRFAARHAAALLSTSAAARKAGREWDYIDGPPASKTKAGGKTKAPARLAARAGDQSTGNHDNTARGTGGSESSAGGAAHTPQANNGMEPISPRMIVRYLDEYVIGQERAKKTLAVAVYNHYNRVRANTLKRQREQLSAAFAAATSAPASGNPFHPPTQQHGYIDPATADRQQGRNGTGSAYPIHQYPFVNRPWNGAFENSGLFIHDTPGALCPANVLKYPRLNHPLQAPPIQPRTLLAKTLAQVLDVPFSAGYVGEDVEMVIQRLLQNCDYDVARAEHGIVFIDEIDKIARKPDSFSMSKDVSGEGVQQGLLRMLEGTVVTVTDKTGHGNSSGGGAGGHSPFSPTGLGSTTSQTTQPPAAPGAAPSNMGVGGPLRRGGPMSSAFGPPGNGAPGGFGSGLGGPLGGGGGKGEVYHVDTSNILFVLSGAFVGLDKIVMERAAKASIGFGNPVRRAGDTTSPVDLQSMNVSPVYFSDSASLSGGSAFIGRLPVLTSVGALNKDSLVRVLVEPKNALVRQYEALLALSGSQLHITKQALYTIAQQAIDKQTGARGLRRIMENLLLEPMFDCPGSSVRHVVIDSDVAAFKKRPMYFSKIQEADVEAAIWNDDGASGQQPQPDASGEGAKKRSAASSA